MKVPLVIIHRKELRRDGTHRVLMHGYGAYGRENTSHFFDLGSLLREGYTGPARIATRAGSAGGVLVGNALIDRPDLFGAAMIDVGLMNPLRSETTANGVGNVPQFGSVASRSGFKALLAMDAYTRVRDGVGYPAALLTTGINDKRVDPWDAAKMAARPRASDPAPLRQGAGTAGVVACPQVGQRVSSAGS